MFLINQFALAEQHELFQGEAFENGKLVYIENHDVTLDDAGNVLDAKNN